MKYRTVLIWLCGIWAAGIGIRMSYELWTANQSYYIVSFNSLWVDFLPLALLGLGVLVTGLYDYWRDLDNTHLGDVLEK